MTTVLEPVDLDALTGLLDRAAAGDAEAFMSFYDATHDCVFTLAVARARLVGLAEGAARTAAERETVRLYVEAWRRAGEQRASGLSPSAWLLTLDLDPVLDQVAACA